MGKNIIKSFVSIFGSQVGVLFFTIMTTPILTRLLGSDGYGDYSFLLSILQGLVVLVSAGSFNAIRKHIAEEREFEKWSDEVFTFYLKIGLLFSILAIITIIIVAPMDFITGSLGEDFVFYFYLLALIMPFQVLLRISRSALMGFSLEHHSEPLPVVDRAIFMAFVIFFSQVGWGVPAVLAGRTVAVGIASIIAIIFVTQRIQISMIFKQTSPDIPQIDLLKYSLSTMILSFLLLSIYHIDVLLLRIMVGSTETGYYRAALVIAEFLWFVPIAIQTALLHSVSQLWTDEQYDKLTAIASLAVRYTLILTILLVLGTAGLADPLLSLYFGQEFTAATVPLLLLLPGALGFAIARPIFAISQGQDNLRVLIFVTLVAAALNLLLNLMLIPRYGMNGAAISTSIAYGSMFGLHVWSARRLGFNPLADIRIKKISITTLIAAVPIIAIPRYIEYDILALTTTPIFGLLIFLSIAFKTKAIELEEIRSFLPDLYKFYQELRNTFLSR